MCGHASGVSLSRLWGIEWVEPGHQVHGIGQHTFLPNAVCAPGEWYTLGA